MLCLVLCVFPIDLRSLHLDMKYQHPECIPAITYEYVHVCRALKLACQKARSALQGSSLPPDSEDEDEEEGYDSGAFGMPSDLVQEGLAYAGIHQFGDKDMPNLAAITDDQIVIAQR